MITNENIDTSKFPSVDFIESPTNQLVDNAPLKPTVKILQEVQTFDQVWRNKGLVDYYNRGLFLGKGDKSNMLLSEFFKKFRRVIEEIIRDELRNSGKTSEEFKDVFKSLESLFNIMITHLRMNGVEIKNEKFMVLLHGFINSYVETIQDTQG